MLTIICGRSGSGKTTRIVSEIRKSVERREGGMLLLVPEQYSHEAERRLAAFCGDTLSLYAEVLSFSRLANRVFTECGGLSDVTPDKGGRLLIMGLALKSVSERLKIYGRQAGKSEFLENLLFAREELSSCMISPEKLGEAALLAGGTIGDKLTDMALICQAFDAILATRLSDPRERLVRLADKIEESGVGQSGHIYIDSFTDFTGQELEVIDRLMRKDAEITVALCLEEDGSEVFKIPQKTLYQLRDMAKRRNIEVQILKLSKETDDCEEDLRYLEASLFDYSAPSYQKQCNAIELYSMNDIVSECELAAARVLDLLREDETLRCRDIAVAARGFEKYEAVCESVFRLYGLPVFISRKADILQKPVIALVSEALKIVSEGWKYSNIFRYLKTNLTEMDCEDRDLLENYCILWNLRGSSIWLKEEPWTMNPRGYVTGETDEDKAILARVDKLRRQAALPLKKLHDGGKNAKTAREQVKTLYEFMDNIHLAERLEEKSKHLNSIGEALLAEEYTQLWGILIDALEQCDGILTDLPMEQEEFAGLLGLVLSSYDVGAIPVALDRLTLGDLEVMREKSLKCLVVLGAADDALPRIGADKGLFTADERRELTQIGLELRDGDDEGICRELHMIYAALNKPTKKLIISYPQSGADGKTRPSFVVGRISKLFNIHPIPESELSEYFRVAAPGPAFQLAVSNKNTEICAAAAACIEDMEGWSGRLSQVRERVNSPRGKLSGASVTSLFGETFNISATRAEKYNSCRFAYFLQYGLRAKQRKKADFEAPEMGTLVHYILENVTRDVRGLGGFKKVGVPKCRELAGIYMKKYTDELVGTAAKSNRFMYLFRRLRETVERIVDDVAEELASSDFEPLDFELRFAAEAEMPPLVLENGDMRMLINGMVDRVDGWLCGDKLYLRVCDYKTGRKEFSLSDVWYGMGLQMLIYLFVLEKYGGARYNAEIVPAGVLYAPARDIIMQLPRNSDPETIEKKRAALLKRSGLILDDPAVIEAMENGAEPKRIPVTIKNGLATGSLASAEKLGKLGRHIEELLTRMGNEMKNGSINADPFVLGGKLTSCEYCEFFAACSFDEKKDNPRKMVSLKADEVWERLNQSVPLIGSGISDMTSHVPTC